MRRRAVPCCFLALVLLVAKSGCAEEREPWFQQAMRWGQVNINERDAESFDVALWMDYFRRCHLDGITINAAGVVAYYPSEVPLHPRSRFLGDRDLFGEIVKAARKNGLRVLARFDPSYQREDFYFAHPDWFSVSKDGRPNLLTWPPEPREKLYQVCPNSPYFWQYMPRVFEEIFTRYDVDGIFGNAWDGYGGICYCQYCRERFHEDTGLELPPAQDRSNPTYRRWVTWRYLRLADVWQFWSETVKRVKHGAIFVPNQTNIAGMRGFIQRGQEVLHTENQGRGSNTPLWRIGMSGKLLRELSGGERPYWLLVGYYLPGWRHISKPQAEQRVWLAEALASGARPWFHIVGADQEDRRGFQSFEDFFNFHWRNDRYFRNLRSRADVALVYSQPTVDFYRQTAGGGPLGSPPRVNDSIQGAYQALLEAGIPFDMLLAEDLEDHVPDRYRVIVLANAAMLSDGASKSLERFVERGGGLVATFETSLYDETGKRREDFGLGRVLGVRTTTDGILGPLGHSYMRIEDAEAWAGTFEHTAILPNTRYLLPVSGEADARHPIWLIPPYPVYPPETSWRRVEKQDVPLAYVREAGKGRVIYFPGDLAATYGTTHLPDHGQLLRTAVREVTSGTFTATVRGPGLLDFSLYEQSAERRLVAFLVNLTNPAAWRAPLTEIVPVGPQTMTIRLHPGESCSSVRSLVSGKEAKFTLADEVLTISVPGVEDFEVLVADLKKSPH
jgi:hypothetical protein